MDACGHVLSIRLFNQVSNKGINSRLNFSSLSESADFLIHFTEDQYYEALKLKG